MVVRKSGCFPCSESADVHLVAHRTTLARWRYHIKDQDSGRVTAGTSML